MPAARTTLKDAVVTAIKADTSIASTRVYKGRNNVTDGSTFPLVYVWQARETTDTQTMTRARSQMRQMELVVDYWNKAATSSALEDAFDTASDAIKTAIGNGSGLSATARQDVLLTSCEYLYEGGEDQPFGCARLTFTVKYFSTEP